MSQPTTLPLRTMALPYSSRRDFLHSAGAGFGTVALASLLADQGLMAGQSKVGNSQSAVRDPLAARLPHFPAKAKSVIWLFMHGAPSQVDTWDYKPELAKRDGQELEGFDQNTGFFAGSGGPIMKSPFRFRQHGQTGKWVSEIFPAMSQHVDEMAFIHSCFAHANNHSPAQFDINTGTSRMGFPCLGSWLLYGLGSENNNLPGFIVMYDSLGRGTPKSRANSWGGGFLPAVLQGTPVKSDGPPINNLRRPGRMTDRTQRAQLELIRRFNQRQPPSASQDSELAARIESFELAFRMQAAAPEAFDIRDESESMHQLYGLDNPRCRHFAKQCLLARRLVERGVRCIQIYSGGMDNADCWDGHSNIDQNHRQYAGETDHPIAGLLTDLRARGLLDSTLVIWCGEFGRLPLVQTGGTGRDHNPHAFTTWLAGGGAKAGARYGATDELGNKSVENRVSINDLHATILHLMGLDHERLTFRHNGRDFRLTDVAGRVVKDVVA